MIRKNIMRKVFRRWAQQCFIATLLLTSVAWSQEKVEERPLFEMDEAAWAMFYDLPSRRFRTIRDAFIRKDFASAKRDLQISLSFLLIESDRATETLRPPMLENTNEIRRIEENLDDPVITAGTLDEQQHKVAVREMGAELQSSDRPKQVYRDKPIALAADTLKKIGAHLDRKVWITAKIDGA